MQQPFFVSSRNVTEEGTKITRNSGPIPAREEKKIDVFNFVDKVNVIITVKGLKS